MRLIFIVRYFMFIYFLFLFFSPDHTKLRLHRQWIRERNETNETTVIWVENPLLESRRRCATLAREIEKVSGSENEIEKAEIEPVGTLTHERRGETASRKCPSLRWPITDPARISRGLEVRRNSNIHEASLCLVLSFLCFPRYIMNYRYDRMITV